MNRRGGRSTDDLLLCGTSPGVLPMKPGSTVDVVIDGPGALHNVYG